MTKKLATLGIILIVLVGVLVPSPNPVYAERSFLSCVASPAACLIGVNIFSAFAELIGQVFMSAASLGLIVSGYLFDEVLKFTIVNMSKNLGSSSGVGASITRSWETLRDIANMFFIFVLIWTAFKAMFDLSFAGLGKAVTNIIIVALIINFSLFFTKVVIDASNIVSVGFYRSITTSNLDTGLTGGTFGSTSNFKGISGGYMRMLGMQTFYSTKILDIKGLSSTQILIIGIVSAIFMLITSVIFIIISVMFVARFIILIFLMILSPLAFVATILPAMEGQFKNWKDALISQSFFAPLFFALTWVVFRVGESLKTTLTAASPATGWDWTSITQDPKNAMALLINYVLIIGFSIAALVFAKSMASKTPFFGAISGGIGTGALGGAALISRNTIGRGSSLIAQSSGLRNAASSGKWYSGAARAGLWTANKGAKGSYDVRNIDTIGKVPGLGKEMDILGKGAGKGGFSSSIEAKAKAKAEYAKAVYGQTPTDKIKDEDEKKKLQEEIKLGKTKEEDEIKLKRKTEAENAGTTYEVNKMAAENHIKDKLKPDFDDLADLKKQRKEKEKELKKARTDKEKPEVIEKLEKESGSLTKSIEIKNEEINDARKNIEETDTVYIDIKKKVEETRQAYGEAQRLINAKIKEDEYTGELQKKIKEHKEFVSSGNRRQKDYANRVGSGVFGWTAGNQAAKIKIDEQAKDKSSKDKVTDAVKALIKEDEEAENKNKAEETKESKVPEIKLNLDDFGKDDKDKGSRRVSV